MTDKFHVKHAAVLGAGVMGAQIAAHLVNSGIDTFLYDLPSDDKNQNLIVDKALANLAKLKPTPLAYKGQQGKIHRCNYEADLESLNQCDLVIEAVVERVDIKQSLYKKIAGHINDKAVLVTNTSGISINQLSEFLPEKLQSRFCGVHFFNPPRYMHLLELIPSDKSDKELLNQLETFFVRYVGKGVVRAKDTPNFIANRIGVFSLMATVYYADKYDIPFDSVDALTGTLIGRPKSATFRTMDVVGLDTMVHVVNTMKESLKDDPWHGHFNLPSWLTGLVDNGALGQKTKAGVYKKEGKTIKVFDVSKKDYVESSGQVDDEIKEIFALKKPEKIFKALSESQSNQAKFLISYFRELFLYSAYHFKDIAENVRDVDLAIRWGFGWQQGPFETWQLAGLDFINDGIMDATRAQQTMVKESLPLWLKDVKAFYEKGGALNINGQYDKRSDLAVYQRQLSYDTTVGEKLDAGTTVFEDDAVRLWHYDKDIAIVSFKSKANCIGDDVIEGLVKAIDMAEKDFDGLVVWQQSPMNFSVGANLKLFTELFEKRDAERLEKVVYDFQRAARRLKFAKVPTVAALRGRALGGGCELLMQCQEVVAAFESYAGLVEVGVGLLPAGGGLKELAIRANKNANGFDSYQYLEQYFKTVAMAEVSGSAYEAVQKGFIKSSTTVVMNTHEVLYNAIHKARFMAQSNYLPPIEEKIPALGREAWARLNTIIVNMAKGGFISPHDKLIAEKIAYVITGGDLNEGQLVDEEWFLRLERQAFVELALTEKTKERVLHLLKTGRPLRN